MESGAGIGISSLVTSVGSKEFTAGGWLLATSVGSKEFTAGGWLQFEGGVGDASIASSSSTSIL